MYAMLMRLKADYPMPLYVTENGCAINDPPPSDERRIHDIQAELEPARKAKIAFDQGRIAPPRRR